MRYPGVLTIIRQAKDEWEKAGGLITPACQTLRDQATDKAWGHGWAIKWDSITPDIFDPSGEKIYYSLFKKRKN